MPLPSVPEVAVASPPRPSRRARATALVATALAAVLAAGVVGAPAVPAALAQDASPSAAPASPVASPLASPAPSSEPLAAPTFDPALAAALQKVVDDSRERIPAPGLSVAIRLADGRTWTGVSGDRQLSPDKPVDPDTAFAIASITKTFVTAVVMQLVEEGKLSLDDHLAKYLPDYPRAGKITIRELLGHTSGVFDYFMNPAYAKQVFANKERAWTPKEILRFVEAPYCKPGDCFHYSNANFVLLGLVVEQVTGRKLSKVIRDRLLDKLGLEHTVFQNDEPTPKDAAHGHLWGGGSTFYDQIGKSGIVPHRSAVTVAWAAGAMASTASDLARWAEALYGGEVVAPELLEQMLTFRPKDDYGLGTRTRTFLKHRAVGHLGGIRGFEDAMWHFPDDGATIVMLSNRGMYNTDKTMKLLVRTLFKHLDAEAAAASPAPDASPAPHLSPAPSASPAP
ncbi:MAG: serine hydrolase domain-containing protein [Chloroflexota bacterium]